jgi:uncharacterized SAM-binding protein YcdF (DUF218 family)
MKNFNFKALLPHVIAIGIFLVVALIYCKPALEGKVLQQHDISQWKGSIQNSVNYSKTHDWQYPLWTNGLFSGMPAYQVGGVGGNMVAGYAQMILTLGLPKPVHFFFLACLCFYILCLCLRLRPWVGIIGALAFAYATYNPVIISVGHDTKMLAIAYMPALLGAVILLMDKKYWLGFVLTALFTSLMVSVNHVQIVYYLFIALGVMAVYALVQALKQKEFKHFAIAASLAAVAVVIGVGTNAEVLMSTYEYQKETIRGGGTVLTDTVGGKKANTSTGLDKDYALAYSMGITEPFVMMVPHMFGGSSDKEEVSQDKSKAIEALTALPQELQQQLPMAYYWGGIKDVGGNVYTSGPPYTGAIICFLAILGMFVLDGKHKWWMLSAILLTIALSWGSYFDGLNAFLYEHLPLYNKFRAPSMILVIPQLLLPALAVLCVDKIVSTEDKALLQKQLMKGLIATGAVFVLLFLFYFSFDFLSAGDQNVLKQVRQMNQPQLTDYVQSFFNGLKEDRKSLMMGDIFRSLGFIAIAVALVFLAIKKTIQPWILIAGLALFSFVDLAMVNKTYLNSENYKEKDEDEAQFNKTAKDDLILADKSDYRVFNMGGASFSENFTSYLYKSVGGYHPAKLRIYQDLIERQLSKQQPNMAVFNMLNTKYFIQKDRNGATQQVQLNDGALGSCWLVKNIVFVKNADAEMAALDNFNPKDTAFVQDTFKAAVPFLPEYDSTASIKLIKNDNDIVTYEFSAAKNQFAVFSEIFYKAGWKAYANGKVLPIAKTNYVLRGVALAPGKYTIEFKFEPEAYLAGKKYGGITSILLALSLLSLLYLVYSRYKKNNA